MVSEQLEISGYIDFYGFSTSAGGWVIAGWVSRTWDGGSQEATAVLEFDARQVSGRITACTYERSDVQKVGLGIVALIYSSDPQPSYLLDAY